MDDESSTLVDDAIDQAGQLVDSIDYHQIVDGEPKGWETLQQIFAEGANFQPSEAELKKTWRPQNKDWCGLFVTFCYQKAGADLSWSLANGRPEGSIRKVNSWDGNKPRATFEGEIQRGDIVVFAKNSHHCLVVNRLDHGKIETIDGNQEFGRILRRSDRLLRDVVAYYRVT